MSRRKLILSQAEAVLSELTNVVSLSSLDDQITAKLVQIIDQLKTCMVQQHFEQIESLFVDVDQLITNETSEFMQAIRHEIDFIFKENTK